MQTQSKKATKKIFKKKLKKRKIKKSNKIPKNIFKKDPRILKLSKTPEKSDFYFLFFYF